MLEVLQEKNLSRQTGVKEPTSQPGLIALETLYQYAEMVSNVYQ